jgi:hypothetical protein
MPTSIVEEFYRSLSTNNDPRSLRIKLASVEKGIEASKAGIKQNELFAKSIRDRLYLLEVQKEQPEGYEALDNFVDLVLGHFVGEQGGWHPDEEKERIQEIIDNAKRARELMDLPDAPYGRRKR